MYLWGAGVAAAGSALLFASVPFRFWHQRQLRPLDTILAGCVLVVALQLVPLPAPVVDRLSPSSGFVVAERSLAPPTAWRPLSIDPASTAHALLVALAAALTFWSARALFHSGGLRTVARGVAFLALLASVLGILQDASRTRLVYWWWAPMSEGPPGFGPFINRNHFAGWSILALGLTLGYLAARTHRADPMDRFRSFAARLRRRMDLRSIWLLATIGLLLIALVLTLSRSGMTGAAVAAIAARGLAGRRTHGRRGWGLIGGLVVLTALLWTGPRTVIDRWLAVDAGQSSRSVIWRETLPVIRDFWPTGTGAGTYGAAMTIYQQADRHVHFNQAHNHYLQIVAEGGVVLGALCLAALVVFVREAQSRLRADRSGMFWMRAGAMAGLGGLAVQSLWETAARMPANALLAATLAAIVLHDAHEHAGHGHVPIGGV